MLRASGSLSARNAAATKLQMTFKLNKEKKGKSLTLAFYPFFNSIFQVFCGTFSTEQLQREFTTLCTSSLYSSPSFITSVTFDSRVVISFSFYTGNSSIKFICFTAYLPPPLSMSNTCSRRKYPAYRYILIACNNYTLLSI